MVFHGPGDLRREDLPVPAPGPGELVLRIDAALTCGTDVKTLRRGHPVMIPRVPTVFGHEFAGTVSAVGAGVTGFRAGDRVVAANSAPCRACPPCRAGRPNLCEDLLFVNGAYGEFIALPPRLVAENVVPLGSTLPAARAYHARAGGDLPPRVRARRRRARPRRAGAGGRRLRDGPARLPARHGRGGARRAGAPGRQGGLAP